MLVVDETLLTLKDFSEDKGDDLPKLLNTEFHEVILLDVGLVLATGLAEVDLKTPVLQEETLAHCDYHVLIAYFLNELADNTLFVDVVV